MTEVNSSQTTETSPEPKTPSESKAQEETKADPQISFDDFLKVKLRCGQILSAEKLEKSEKLLLLKVDLAEKEPRQVVAGISKHYEADELPGRKVVVVANLKPAKLMGHLSEGMLLAASDEQGNLELVSPGISVEVGGQVS